MNILVITDDYCLMAMVIFVNHFPVYVTLARGCEDSRNMLEGQYNDVNFQTFPTLNVWKALKKQ